MILKYYGMFCDKCGAKIRAWQTTSVDKAVAHEKKSGRGTKITKRMDGFYNIKCAKCQKEENEQLRNSLGKTHRRTSPRAK